MKIHFESNLKHQQDAVAAVSALFEGAPYTRPEERFWLGEVSSNILKLPEADWYQNVQKIAAENGIEDSALVEEPDFTIEMETGTGKTYVYLRTIFELHRRYGLHKFFIVVPSVPIRQGTLTQLRLTKGHFRELYATEAEVTEYDSKRAKHLIEAFCRSPHLSIVVINKQAFDSNDNILNDPATDRGNLLDKIAESRPIIIMDEPQEGMDTPNMKQRFAAFNPLFKLRYSATHREPKNVIHRLTPFDSYNQGLVKKIAVLSIHETNTQSNVSIVFKKLNLSSGDPTATLQLQVKAANGDIAPKPVKVKKYDELEAKTGNPVYHGWKVEDIGTTDLYDGEGYVSFTNGERITEGNQHGHDKATIFREQIRRTIQTHFRRKKQLAPLGIKPLSLFFIDRVANYTDPEGLIRRLFQEEYLSLYRQTYQQAPPDLDAVHNGYFAQSASGEYTDSKRTMETNTPIYKRILNDKEWLLSFDSPLEFIFSHSALGVGWDNPNVFTICTLNESESEIKKRQEIGRGLRLCVISEGDNKGHRYRDAEDVAEGKEVNLLTVVANQSYYAFAKTYQDELKAELGQSVKPPPIRNQNKQPVSVRLNTARFDSADFKALWERIAQKTRCKVFFREDELIAKGVEALSSLTIDENRLEVSLTYWKRMSEDGDIDGQGCGSTRASLNASFARLDVVGELARNTALSDMTAAAILSGLPEAQKTMLSRNPMLFLAEATKKLRHVLNAELVRLVKYEPTGEAHPLTLFKEAFDTTRSTTPTPERGLYEAIVPDSDVEERFARSLDDHHLVQVFVKLPKEYRIPTPIGWYNPDFALVIEKQDLDNPNADPRFYFTVETKGTAEWEKLKPEEHLKIQCAVRHFEAIGLKAYLAPVEDLKSFDTRARERVGQTFFDM
jgi:type III restriction enzyme